MKLVKSSTTTSTLQFIVSDTGLSLCLVVLLLNESGWKGVGMAAEFIPQLFTPYSQQKLSTVREHGGALESLLRFAQVCVRSL